MSVIRMDWHWYGMPAAEEGGFVSYYDYAKLQAALECQYAQVEGLQEALAVYRKYIDLDVSHISQKAQAALDAIKESKSCSTFVISDGPPYCKECGKAKPDE